ncbi:MAG: DUF2628 domain-containing protein [Clostridia bacterium]|nr:DUF2628 domain-containing protein [Clostridia bacterium]
MEIKENFDINQIQDPDKELVKAWIGTKYQEFYLQKYYKQDLGFNFSAFLIPDLFFLTRKLWIEAFAIIIFDFLIIWFNGVIPYPVALVARVILGVAYYPLYSASIKRKIKKYKEQGLSYEEQLNKAKTLGGDKITVAVLMALIIVIFGGIILGIWKANLDYSNGRNTNNNSYYSNNRYSNNKKNSYDDSNKSEKQKANELEESQSNTTVPKNEKIELELLKTSKDEVPEENLEAVNIENLKINYDNRKWKQIDIPEEFADRYLAMIQNKEVKYVLGLRSIDEEKGDIFLKNHISTIISASKTGMSMRQAEVLGYYPNIETEVKKINDKKVYLRTYYNYSQNITIYNQVDNEHYISYAFNILNNENLNENDILEINTIMANVEVENQ